MQLIFSSNNKHKIMEVRQLLDSVCQIRSLADIGCTIEIPETSETIEGNASQKSFFVYKNFGVNCFSDDTGLEIEALQGRPGVLSARFAGEQKSDSDNMKKVLDLMKGVSNRKAHFKTIISLVVDGVEKQFEGIVNGIILDAPSGGKGFGYDPIFLPDGGVHSFAEMTPEEKNKISHRAIAVKKLVNYLLTERC